MTTSLFLLFVSNATASLNRYILRDISGSVARPKKMNETLKSSFASLVVIVLSLFLRAHAATSLIVACPLKCYIFAKRSHE